MVRRVAVETVFWLALLFAVLSIVALTLTIPTAAGPWWLIGLCGMAPLAAYHVFLYRANRRAGGLPQSTIDTVYYFGFIVTIATLAAAVLAIALRPENITSGGAQALPRVGATFGLGLLATGYALAARIQLMIQSSQIDEETVSDQVSRVYQELSRTLLVIQRSAIEFESLGITLVDRTRRNTEALLQGVSATLVDASKQAATEYAYAGTAMRNAVAEFGTSIRAALPAEETDALRTAVRESSSTLGTLQARINKLAEKTQQLDAVIEQLHVSLAAASSSASTAVGSLGALQAVAERLNELSPVVSGVGGELANVSSAAANLNIVMREAWRPSARDAADVSVAMQSQVSALGAHASALSDAEKAVRREVEWRRDLTAQGPPIDELRGSIGAVSRELADMAIHVSRLSQSLTESNVPTQMSSFQEALGGARQKIRELGEAAGAFAGDVAGPTHRHRAAERSETRELDEVVRLLKENAQYLSALSRTAATPRAVNPSARSLWDVFSWTRR